MTIDIRYLRNKDFHEVYLTSVEAFKDYALDIRYMTETVLYNRAVKNGIVFDASAAAYQDGRMVGYTLVGIGPWKNTVSAFDIGTGIVKPHRGQGLAVRMFDSILQKLTSKGIHKFVLEVLQNNASAVKAYEKAGFHVERELDCFQLEFAKRKNQGQKAENLRIQPLKKDRLASFQEFLDWPPSWENSFAALNRIPDELTLLSAENADGPCGLLAYYPGLNWIMCLAVAKTMRRRGIAAALLDFLQQEVQSTVPQVKLVNVLHTDAGAIRFLSRMGFAKFAGQYEMELDF